MIRISKNTRVIHYASIALILIIFLGLQIFQKSNYHKSNPNGKRVPVEISINQKNATISAANLFPHFQHSWILNKDNFRLLTFNQTKYLDNKKVNQKIFQLDNIRKNSPVYTLLIIHNQIFPQENPELPVLS
jgi:hypothetical protein